MEILGDFVWPLLEGMFQIIVEYILFPVAEWLFEECILWVLEKSGCFISKVGGFISCGSIHLWRKMARLAANAHP